MTLRDRLDGDPSTLRWRCAHERAEGLDVLEIARPGLVLEPAGDRVPRAVFHAWMFANAERMLRAYIGFGQLEDHESEWLGQGVALLAEPLEPDESSRMLALMSLASLNTFSAIRHGVREMGDVYAWTGRALTWAAKRAMRERRCPHDPVSLCAELTEMHARLAGFKGEDGPQAARLEREAQVVALLRAWQDAIG